MEECTYCGDEYSRLGQHWAFNEEHRPSLTNEQYETVKGLVLGDGNINHGDKNPSVRANMINEDFLVYLDSLFGGLSLGVSLLRTAEEEAKRNRDRGWSVDADPENYNDIYHWETRRHPELDTFEQWYGEDGKTVPDDLELSSTALRVWYCCDGCITPDSGYGSFSIAINNERGNKEKVMAIFERSPVPSPDIWYEGEINTCIRWNVDSGKEVFDVIGSPLPGFECKWPDYRQN